MQVGKVVAASFRPHDRCDGRRRPPQENDSGLESTDGRASRGTAARHDAAAVEARARALLPAPGRRRLHARRHRPRPARRGASSGPPSSTSCRAPSSTIFITHFHPDHLGATADVRELTGARVVQGRLDAEQSAMTWKSEEWASHLAGWFRRNGVPDEVTEELLGQGELFRPFIRPVFDPELVDDGDDLHGWELVAAPGHADGQLTLLRDGVLIAADHLLAADHADGRALAGEPARSARGLPRIAAAHDRPRSRDCLQRSRRHGHRPGRPGQRADRPSRRAAARHRGRASAPSRARPTKCRSRCSATICGRRRAGLPSPRRSPTSSDSSGTARPNVTSCSRTGTSPASPILPRSSGRTSLQYRRPGDRGMTVFLELLGVAVLILLNGFFVAAEYSLVTVRRTRLKELIDEGNRPGARRDEDHERSGALHRGDAARRHAHLARHRRHRRDGALRPVRDLPRNRRRRRARVLRDHVHARRRR